MSTETAPKLQPGFYLSVRADAHGTAIDFPMPFEITPEGRNDVWCVVSQKIWDKFAAPIIRVYRENPENPVIAQTLEYLKTSKVERWKILQIAFSKPTQFFPQENTSRGDAIRIDDKVFIALVDFMATTAKIAQERGLDQPESAPFKSVAEAIKKHQEHQATEERARAAAKKRKITRIKLAIATVLLAIAAFSLRNIKSHIDSILRPTEIKDIEATPQSPKNKKDPAPGSKPATESKTAESPLKVGLAKQPLSVLIFAQGRLSPHIAHTRVR